MAAETTSWLLLAAAWLFAPGWAQPILTAVGCGGSAVGWRRAQRAVRMSAMAGGVGSLLPRPAA
jgi:hypothetical protein